MGCRKEMKGSYQARNYDVYHFQTFWQVPDLFLRQWLLVRSGPGLHGLILVSFVFQPQEFGQRACPFGSQNAGE